MVERRPVKAMVPGSSPGRGAYKFSPTRPWGLAYIFAHKYYVGMKTLKCDLCEVTAQGETFEEWMKALMPHYMQAHADIVNDPKNGKEEQEKWMAENKARFEAA
jgi:predicted RNase H-like HicB family nuclease